MTEKPKLFGTDGVRGVAGRFPLDRETVWKLGRALGVVLESHHPASSRRVALGEDTRESSAWISRTFAAGLCSSGAELVYAGVITTPGVAFLTRQHGLAAGVMISASHNPYQDNGIKILERTGMKFPEPLELEVERELALTPSPESNHDGGTELTPDPHLLEDYLEYLERLATPAVRSAKFKIVADCANGAASRVAPKLFKKLGIEARVLNHSPNGRNINLDCGSLYPDGMARETESAGAALGIAFDGDADRAIFATPDGRIADGDHVLFATAPAFDQRGELKGHAVVGTLMTNVGLELALAARGIALKRTSVGDRYVLEEMLRSGINLGGEPSGHIIFSDISLAGDGIITLMQMLRLLADTGEPLPRLFAGLRQFPQVIRNVRIKEKRLLESIPQVARAVEECRREFGDRGRVVVRCSGTEAVARVMVEGEQSEAVDRHAASIVAAIESVLGAP